MEVSPNPAASGSYQWTVPNVAASEGKLESPTFEVGGYHWRLVLYPKGDGAGNRDHVSLFLSYPEAHTCPPGSPLCPAATFSLAIKNDNGRGLDYVVRTGTTFTSAKDHSGWARFIKRDRLTADSGFLTADGSLVLRVDVMVENPKPPSSPPAEDLRSDPGLERLAGELLALLDDPEGTSDLTVVVGASNGGAAAGGSASGSAGSGGGASTPSGSRLPQRSFRVHRAVLAARCPFFRTLFSAGMADSAARELPLPDADPDAFAVLLRYMYGGEVPPCERAVHRAAVPLCDTLLLPKVKEELERQLVESADAETITTDLLWAAGPGREEVFEKLAAVYRRVAKNVDPAQVVAMAAANPQLMPRLLISVTQQGQGPGQQQGQGQQQVQPQQQGKGAKGKGGRKRARA